MKKEKKRDKVDSTLPLDLLGRDAFVKQVFQVANTYHLQKKTACYAINGPWGSGKTYVLDKLEHCLKEPGKTEGKYEFLVLRYNCWEYDYYDEPLLSIVATMLDALDQYQLSNETKEKLKSAFRAVGCLLLNGFITYVDNKTGGLASGVADVVSAYEDDKKENLQKIEAFNDKLPFQKALELLRDQIASLSKEHTVIFLVDELDRCLPEYAIRVLERLHHIFEGINNVQLVFSVDRTQLEHVIKELYGPSADTTAYLKKFISFELKLDIGTLTSVFDADYNPEIDGDFDKRFESYVALFNPVNPDELEEISDFKINILNGFDIRSRIALVEKAELIHRMTWPKTKEATAHDLCEELFLTVFDAGIRMIQHDGDVAFGNVTFDTWKSTVIEQFNVPNVIFPELPCFKELNNIFRENNHHGKPIYWNGYNRIACDTGTLYGAILRSYRMALTEVNLSQQPIASFWSVLSIME